MTAIGFLPEIKATFGLCLANLKPPAVDMVLLQLHVLQSRPLPGLLTAARSIMRDTQGQRENGGNGGDQRKKERSPASVTGNDGKQ
jgi:hypothetical protein